jgi:presenilin-like A22 family membrane protease
LVSYVVLDVYHCVCIYDIVCAAVLLSMVWFTLLYYEDGGHCWIVLDEDGRSKSVGFAMRWGLAYGPGQYKLTDTRVCTCTLVRSRICAGHY